MDKSDLAENPAIQKAMPIVSPKALMEAVEDPTVLSKTARADLYVELARMRQLSKDGRLTLRDRVSYAQTLHKLATLDQGPDEAALRERVPPINIIFSGNTEQSVRIAAGTDYVDADHE